MSDSDLEPRETLAADLEEAVEEFVDHLRDDLPAGPGSELGGEVPSGRKLRSQAEWDRMAAAGSAMVSAYAAAQHK
jgi:hypothetical protein